MPNSPGEIMHLINGTTLCHAAFAWPAFSAVLYYATSPRLDLLYGFHVVKRGRIIFVVENCDGVLSDPIVGCVTTTVPLTQRLIVQT